MTNDSEWAKLSGTIVWDREANEIRVYDWRGKFVRAREYEPSALFLTDLDRAAIAKAEGEA